MTRQQHEIPTHLNVEDQAFFGLSIRQMSHLIVGLAGSYWLWTQWPDLLAVVRLGLAGLWLLIAVTVALVRPYGRGLEEWTFVVLHFVLVPKRSVWRVPEPDPESWRPTEPSWVELTPELWWREGQR
jgi:hypothetical protein